MHWVFFYFKGNSFKASVDLKISVDKSGMYKIVYYVLMYCNQTGCESAQDYIEIKAISNNNKQKAQISLSKRLYLKDIQVENKWHLKTLEFLVTEDVETDLTVNFINY